MPLAFFGPKKFQVIHEFHLVFDGEPESAIKNVNFPTTKKLQRVNRLNFKKDHS